MVSWHPLSLNAAVVEARYSGDQPFVRKTSVQRGAGARTRIQLNVRKDGIASRSSRSCGSGAGVGRTRTRPLRQLLIGQNRSFSTEGTLRPRGNCLRDDPLAPVVHAALHPGSAQHLLVAAEVKKTTETVGQRCAAGFGLRAANLEKS